MKKSKATVIYKTALHLLKVGTSSKEMEGNTFNKLILIIALLYKDTEHSHIKKDLYALIQSYMLAIHSSAEWYKYFESNSSGACFMTEPIYWDRDGKECLFDYIDCRFLQFVQLISAISSSNNKEAPLLILYWLFTEEKYSYYPDYTPRGITYEQVVEINYLKERLESTHGFEEFKMAYQLIQTITETKSTMENSFSFKYIKLGVSLVLLLVSAIVPGLGQYIFLALGGIFLMTAFASFGCFAYRGFKSKKGYRIGRYVIAILLLIVSAIQIYVAIAMPNQVHYSIYSSVVDVALITYLAMYKPSTSSTIQKALKCIGYALILIGVHTLQSAQSVVNHLTYTALEINWGIMSAITLMFIIGIVLLCISYRHPKTL